MDAPPAVVLASGGLDSCVTAALAAVEHPLAMLHASYGQRTQRRELAAFHAVADHYEARQRLVIDLPHLRQIGASSLTDPRLEIPQTPPEPGQTPSTYVPFRNANLLAAAVAWAEALGAVAVYIGVHAADAGYPDCSAPFIAAFNEAVRRGTRPDATIQVRAPLVQLDKAAIVRQGLCLAAPLALTWSCYRDEDRPCGRCHSCRLRQQGFAGAGAVDPALR